MGIIAHTTVVCLVILHVAYHGQQHEGRLSPHELPSAPSHSSITSCVCVCYCVLGQAYHITCFSCVACVCVVRRIGTRRRWRWTQTWTSNTICRPTTPEKVSVVSVINSPSCVVIITITCIQTLQKAEKYQRRSLFCLVISRTTIIQAHPHVIALINHVMPQATRVLLQIVCGVYLPNSPTHHHNHSCNHRTPPGALLQTPESTSRIRWSIIV